MIVKTPMSARAPWLVLLGVPLLSLLIVVLVPASVDRMGESAPQWMLVDHDEFNDGALDRSHWTPFETSGNTQPDDTIWDSRQITFASEGDTKFLRLKNSMLPDENGQLKLTSAGVGGWGWTGDATGAEECGDPSYRPGPTSVCRKYGRYDVRLRFAEKVGITGVGLLFPPNGVWPPEIDFFEVGYQSRSSQKMEISHHYVDKAEDDGRGQSTTPVHEDFTQWRTISTRWQPGEVSVYVDGDLRFRTTENIPNTVMWPGLQNHFKDRPGFSMKPGESIDFDIDWVRVYRFQRLS